MKDKILVTGGAGFIGSNLIKEMVSDYEVFSVDNYSSGSERNHVEGCKYIQADISEGLEFLSGHSFLAVFHLAASARINKSFKEPDKYFKSNVVGTFNVCQFALKNGSFLIYAGSSSVHGGLYKNPYTFSKGLGEDVVKMHSECFGLRASMARFYNVYGPGESTDGNATLIGACKGRLSKGERFVVYGDGTKTRDFTHVYDIVDGLIGILKSKAFGLVFEFGRGRSYSVLEVFKMFGQEEFDIMPDKPGEVQSTLCESSLAKDVLGWVPKRNLEDYIIDYMSRSKSSSMSLSSVTSQ